MRMVYFAQVVRNGVPGTLVDPNARSQGFQGPNGGASSGVEGRSDRRAVRRTWMEERFHYLCRVRFDGIVIFVVWHSVERDGFVRDEAGRLRAACTPEALTGIAGARNVVPVNSEPIEYDFDRIRAWCAAPDVAGVDHAAFLDASNFLNDLAGLHDGADTPYTRLSRGATECYDRLFWGSNPPAVTPPGARFEPAWQADELIAIRRVFEAGFGLLESELRVAGVLASCRPLRLLRCGELGVRLSFSLTKNSIPTGSRKSPCLRPVLIERSAIRLAARQRPSNVRKRLNLAIALF